MTTNLPVSGFELIDHMADWSIRVWAPDLSALLATAALGMNRLMVADETAVPRTITRHLTLDAYDAESLLVDWLTELAYWAEMEQMVFPDVRVTAVPPTANGAPAHLEAHLQGGPAPELVKHIKAVTYHNLAITPTANGLEATIVFDV
jgi:SHS2 domain-containing protein